MVCRQALQDIKQVRMHFWPLQKNESYVEILTVMSDLQGFQKRSSFSPRMSCLKPESTYIECLPTSSPRHQASPHAFLATSEERKLCRNPHCHVGSPRFEKSSSFSPRTNCVKPESTYIVGLPTSSPRHQASPHAFLATSEERKLCRNPHCHVGSPRLEMRSSFCSFGISHMPTYRAVYHADCTGIILSQNPCIGLLPIPSLLGAGFFVAGSVFYVTRCFLLPVFSVAGKAGFCVAAVFSVAANAGFLLPGWCFMLLLWCLLLPERCVVLLLGVLCVRTVFYVAEMVFCVAATPAGTHEGTRTKRCRAARLPPRHAFASDASSHTTSRRGQSPHLRGGVENPSEANAWHAEAAQPAN